MIGSSDRREAAVRPPAMGPRAVLSRVWMIGLALLLRMGTVSAAESEAGPPGDFREKVMIAYGTVFAVFLAYLVLSHRKNAKVREEIELLEERIDELS